MPTLLNNITQDEYDRLSREYLEEVGQEGSDFYLHFFSTAQKRLEQTIRDKFTMIGIVLVKDETPGKFVDNPGMRYHLVFGSDPTQQYLVPKVLNLSSLMKELRLVDPVMSSSVIDVKIVDPSYLSAKIEEITDIAVARFVKMLKQRADKLNLPESLKQLINTETIPHA